MLYDDDEEQEEVEENEEEIHIRKDLCKYLGMYKYNIDTHVTSHAMK